MFDLLFPEREIPFWARVVGLGVCYTWKLSLWLAAYLYQHSSAIIVFQ